MSERTTGATPEQIEASAKRWYARAFKIDPEGWGDVTDRDKAIWCAVTETNASDLVRPDQRIVDVADLKRMNDFFEFDIADDEDHESYKRITALIGGES